MQTSKEEIRNSIINAARNEFLKNGFEKASVRTITANAATSKSNVYNYFENKDRLFHAVVEPTLCEVQEGLEKLRSRNRQKNAYTIDAQKEVMSGFIRFSLDHCDDLTLLFFCSSGSSLQRFRNDLIQSIADVLGEWVKSIKPEKKVSRFFLYSVAGFYIGVIEKFIVDEKMRDQGKDDSNGFNEFLQFVYGGWSNTLV